MAMIIQMSHILSFSLKSEMDGSEVITKSSKGCSDDEILAVLGHELGHWKLNHTLKHLVIGQVFKFKFILLYLISFSFF